MALHRRAAKRDANEPDVVKAFTKAKCRVWKLSGRGVPDLLALQRWTASPAQLAFLERFGLFMAAEVKNPDGLNRATESQVAQERDGVAPWPVLRGPEEARALVGRHAPTKKRLPAKA